MEIEHRKSLIEIDGQPLLVSADAVKVDGLRRRFTWEEMCVMAFQLGGRLLTCAEADARYEQADLKNKPHTQRLWEGEDDSAEHSRLIDADIEAHGSAPNIVGCAGKVWVQREPGTPDGQSPLYGWHVDSGYKTWKGIKLHTARSDETLAKVIQPYSPTAHSVEDPNTKQWHPDGHSDYSMTGVFAFDVDDQLEAVTTEPEPSSDKVVELVSDAPPDTLPAPVAVAGWDDLVDATITARNWRKVEQRDINTINLHSTENQIRVGRRQACSVANWFAGPGAPTASAHFIIDEAEVISGVPVRTGVAWAAPGGNRHGIQIEMVGQAFKTNWMGGGFATMALTAKLVARLCLALDIPAVRLDPDDLKAGKRGITTHASVTVAFRKSTHVDPGGPGDKRWPWEKFLEMVRAEM